MSIDPASMLGDTSRIDPDPVRYTLATGTEVELVPLATRQLFRLLKIITHGARTIIAAGYLQNFDLDSAEFGTRLVTLVLMSIPDAEEEALQFIASMCRPVGIYDGPVRELTKQQRESNETKYGALNKDMFNPDPGDLISLIELIVQQEAADLQALGKRLWSMAAPYFKTGQDAEADAEAPTAQEVTRAYQDLGDTRTQTYEGTPVQVLQLPDVAPDLASPPPSTSSAPSTAGQTSRSSASRSGASARSSQPSPSGAATGS